LAALKRAGKLDPDTVILDGVTVRAFGGGEGRAWRPTSPLASWRSGAGNRSRPRCLDEMLTRLCPIGPVVNGYDQFNANRTMLKG
jgi:hypothetical protein